MLTEKAPSRGRAVGEALLLVVSVFAPGMAAKAGQPAVVVLGALLLIAAGALLWPLRRFWQLPLLLVICTGVVASAWATTAAPVPPRLGINFEGVPGGVRVLEVHPGMPAEGHLRAGDTVTAVAQEKLPAAETEAEQAFRERIAAHPDGAVSFTVEREGAQLQAELPLGPKLQEPSRFRPGAVTWLCVRAVAVCLLVWLLLRRSGQGLHQLGLRREGLRKELLLGLPALAATYVTHVVVSIPLVVIASLLSRAAGEALARKELAESLVGLGLSIPAFAGAMVLVATFEELAFRGFLIPRLKVVFGNWWVALAVSAVVFGLGHLYEGVLGVFQTMVLGAFFGAVFLYRRRLEAVMVAHAGFNTLNFALMVWLTQSGALDALQKLAPK